MGPSWALFESNTTSNAASALARAGLSPRLNWRRVYCSSCGRSNLLWYPDRRHGLLLLQRLLLLLQNLLLLLLLTAVDCSGHTDAGRLLLSGCD